jgi:hypothetical protein
MARPLYRSFCSFRNRILGFLVLAASLFLASCQMARMSLPANLAAEAREMACRGRQGFKFNEAFEFEPFKVLDVHRSWTTVRDWDAGWIASARARQRYEFTTWEPRGPFWDGRCVVGAEATSLELRDFLGGDLEVEVTGIQSLLGLLKERGTKKPWKLVLGQSTGEQSLGGVLEKDDVRITIEGRHDLAQTPLPIYEAAGYILTLKGEAVAAVEVINKGAVWIHPGVSPEIRGVLAAAASALLLYQDLLALDLTRDGYEGPR